MSINRTMTTAADTPAEDVTALFAKALQYVVDGNLLARYAARRANDTPLSAMCVGFVEGGERLEQLLRRQLAAGLRADEYELPEGPIVGF